MVIVLHLVVPGSCSRSNYGRTSRLPRRLIFSLCVWRISNSQAHSAADARKRLPAHGKKCAGVRCALTARLLRVLAVELFHHGKMMLQPVSYTHLTLPTNREV